MRPATGLTRAATHEYRLLGRLGAGGMAAVYLGSMETPAGERRVAIKRLLAGRELDKDDNERFIAEAKLVFRLTHANICQVIDLGVNDEGTFILMEYVEGLDLRGLLRKMREGGRQLDVACAVHVAREIAQALDYAHRRTDETGHPLQLVHGDVTPQNVLVSIEGEVKLADFGIASATRAHAPGNSLRGGTPGYMAPEVMDGANDHRADIYSLGATLFHALGGRILTDRPIDVATLVSTRSEVADDLARIIERAVSPQRDDRYLSAGELEQALAFHLARRFPAFTPSLLAAVVRSCGARALTEPPIEQNATLVSLVNPTPNLQTHAALRADGPHDTRLDTRQDSQLESMGTPARAHTAPVVTRRSRTPMYGVIALLLAASAVVMRYGARTSAGTLAVTPPAKPMVAPETPQPVELPSPPQPRIATTSQLLAPAVTPTPAPTHVRAHRATDPHRTAPAAEGSGLLTVNAEPWGAILLDGKRIADQTPLYRYAVSAGAHTIVVFDPDTGKRAAPRRVVVRAGEAQVVGFRW